jgi:phage terminase small subunit
MLDQLKELAEKLGRTPLARELIAASRRGECAYIETFRRHFGTYNNALRAAGLRVRPRAYSRGQLLHSLRELARRLGHRPTARDVNQASQRGECPSAKTYDNWFGRLSAAIHEARLNSMRPRRTPRKSRRP